MKAKIIIPLLVILSICSLKAQEAPNQHFRQAFEEISAMLDGKQPIDFEKAVFITENAYRDNSLNYEDFKSALNVHSVIIEQFIKANDKYDWKQFVRGNMGIAPDMEIEAKERYRKALANYAIFTYLTDTLTVKLEGQNLLHLPYTYSNEDPFGTADWKNSQTINLLETQKGNCYSLVTLFKIFSERFKSEANIVTAPQHIYIEHRDPKGSRFNVEVATRSFPDMGSIQTLTYTTREALLNDISMRKLDLKQSIGLSLVYLAKGYEYKNKVKDDEFILTCANTALQHDPKNLNALLLKAQVYEQRVMKNQMLSAPYENMLAEFYKFGYRQMPDDMREIILSKIQGRPSTVTPTDKSQNVFANIAEQSRTVTLSNGLFEEFHTPQKIVRYGQTIFDTEKSKIVKFLDEDNSSYQVDPVVFALSVDPLTKSYPELTPYQFAGNTPIQAIDLDGLEPVSVHALTPKNLRPKLEKSEWHELVLKGGGKTTDQQSFSAAAKYNTLTKNSKAYSNIYDRHQWYNWAANETRSKDNFWFAAAADVTSWTMVGASDMMNLHFMNDEHEKILRGANKFLLEANFENFGDYVLNKGPIKWQGNSYGNLSGKDLDNQMVVIEMTTLQGYLNNYMDNYIKENGQDSWKKVHKGLNSLFSSEFLNSFTPGASQYAQEEFKKAFGNEKFDFMKLKHRIFQGQKMAEYLRSNEKKN